MKFANSLRLRLAMRLASIAPDKARLEIEKIKENDYGFFERGSEKVAVSTKSGYINPLGELNLVWNETYMNASMESILTGYDDPRLKAYFVPCTDEKFRGEYRGIRQGTCFAHNHYAGLSRLSVTQATDAPLMTASEVWFLRAEAALRGWTDENEENCYRNGVMTSFEQWGVYGVEDYLKSERIASNFVDTYERRIMWKLVVRYHQNGIRRMIRRKSWRRLLPKSGLPCFPKAVKLGLNNDVRDIPACFPYVSIIAGTDV